LAVRKDKNKTICPHQHSKTGSWKKEEKEDIVVSFTHDIIDDLMNGVSPDGIFPYTDLLKNAHERNFHGIAVNRAQRKKTYILFINGYPEGAVVADNTGELYGDKAIYLIKGSDPFILYPVNPDRVERIVYSCRIYDKSHFTDHYSFSIPEVGKKADGVGKAVIALKKDGGGVAGVPIRIRKDGQIIAHDISDETGQASFRLLFGKYEIIIVRHHDIIDVFEFSFVPELQGRQLDLELP